jgi:glutathione S-transferase
MAEYIDVREARGRSGLRLVLTAGVPGPWGEAAKAVFDVKKIPYVKVRQEGGGENPDLAEWTGQTSAPVAAWNDEPPRTTSRDILFLAERIAPEPALLPDAALERVVVLGLCDEIHGELGFGWCRRLMLIHSILPHVDPSDPEGGGGVVRMARKYGYDPVIAGRAKARCEDILRLLADRLASQRAAGRRFLVGDSLTAADLYWATCATLLEPLPHDLCPMPDYLRQMYTVTDEGLRRAAGPHLIAHRDDIYREFLELPVDF